jgi:two-component system, OmpR family, sensor histidine kinase CreC
MGLSIRILLGYFLIVGCAGAFILKTVVDQLQPVVRETIEEVMVDTVHLLAELAAQDFTDGQFNNQQFGPAIQAYVKRDVKVKIWHFEKVKLDFDIYLTDRKGKVIFDSSGKWLGQDFSNWRNVNLSLQGRYGARSTREIYGDDRSSVYHVSAPIQIKSDRSGNSTIVGTVTIAKPVNSVEPIIDKARSMVLFQGSLLILAALVTGLLITWRLQLGIKKLLVFAEQATQGETTSTPKIRTTELKWLANAMATMRDELRGKRYMEHYTQGLAHELKSPLSALAASNELLSDAQMSNEDRQRFIQLNSEQISKMRYSIDQMLAAARIEHLQAPEQMSSVDARQLLAECLSEAKALADAKQIELKSDTIASATSDANNASRIDAQINLQTELIIYVDRALLKLAIANLVSNAIDFSSIKSVVLASIKQDAKNIVFTIQDCGPGIPEFAMSKIYDRFFSLPRPDGRKGSGLGLSLAAQVAKLHAGKLQVSNLAMPGQTTGCSASLSIPENFTQTSRN